MKMTQNTLYIADIEAVWCEVSVRHKHSERPQTLNCTHTFVNLNYASFNILVYTVINLRTVNEFFHPANVIGMDTCFFQRYQ